MREQNADSEEGSEYLPLVSAHGRPLFAIPVQRNHLTVLTSFDRSTAALIREAQSEEIIVGVGNLGEADL